MYEREYEDTEAAMADAMRRFLAYVQRWTRTQFPTVPRLPVPASEAAPPGAVGASATLPAGEPLPPATVDLFTSAQARGWWTEALDAAGVESTLNSAWAAGWRGVPGAPSVDVAADVSRAYFAGVTDRLSRSALPLVPDEAFDLVRDTLGRASAEGWTVGRTAERIAVEFSWDHQRDYWQAERARVDAALDELLDPLGPPGAPAREAARLSDPRVAALQDDKAYITRTLDHDASQWDVRAERIARTETTGAANAGAQSSAQAAGMGVKVWQATGGPRTRETHLAASGQCVALDDTFLVGGEQLSIPGDPAGSPAETVNCRCAMLFADSCEDALERYGSAFDAIESERDRRDD